MNIIKLSNGTYFDLDNLAVYSFIPTTKMVQGRKAIIPTVQIDCLGEQTRFEAEEALILRDYLERHIVNAYEEKEN
jgi:hypothetical protein